MPKSNNIATIFTLLYQHLVFEPGLYKMSRRTIKHPDLSIF